ncbi:MAG: dihydroorotate dehydrogenase [Planctomycetes bacterium]|nr:dihydroorotate dehydrogenase [Planctomycetota bacterium]
MSKPARHAPPPSPPPAGSPADASPRPTPAGVAAPDLAVEIGRLALKNPLLTASGTFGYGKEFEQVLDFSAFAGVIGKTITREPRAGNPPPRIVETPSGMLNAIGLPNPGVERYCRDYLPYLRALPCKVIVNVGGMTLDDFVACARRVAAEPGVDAIELNISCPNVEEGGRNFATHAEGTHQVVSACRRVAGGLPLIAKLTPNVADIAPIARAAEEAGADAISLINPWIGMEVDWRARRPALANVTGGLSGPAIRPVALRFVWQAARAVKIPVIGIGGISCADDVLRFMVAGATAVELGTINFVNPRAGEEVLAGLNRLLPAAGVARVRDLIGTLAVTEPGDDARDRDRDRRGGAASDPTLQGFLAV